MGVKTNISLDALNTLFRTKNFISLDGISAGLIDSTYHASTQTHSYILKKHESASRDKIEQNIQLLETLSTSKLNVARCIEKNHPWYLYEKLQGEMPRLTHTYHIQALARFLSKMHKTTYKLDTQEGFYESYDVDALLSKLKQKHFSYYKKLHPLSTYKPLHQGIIHGDIFRDNTVFEKQKIGVFDFIDCGSGSFVLDVAISLIGFGIKKESKYFINLYLRTYNQRAKKKLHKAELLVHLSIASKFYALLRIEHHQSTTLAKKLL